MVKFPEADVRLFKNIFVCKKCKQKIRAPTRKVLDGKIKCKRCKRPKLRPKRKK